MNSGISSERVEQLTCFKSINGKLSNWHKNIFNVLCVFSVLSVFRIGLAQSPPRQSVSLDIYNRDLAMIRDVRTADLAKGVQAVDVTGIAQGIFGHTAAAQVLDGKLVTTKELTYHFDLVSQEKLLERLTGRWFLFSADDATYQGRLLAVDEKHLFLQPDTLAPQLQVVERGKLTEMFYPELPGGLFTRPTLRWKVDAEKKRDETPVEFSYLTTGITWFCDYRGELIGDDSMRLSANFTIANDLAMDFHGAKVALVVGKPHQSSDPPGDSGGDEVSAPGKEKAAKTDAGPERLGEVYRYTLPEPLDLQGHQTVQVPFFGGRTVKVEKRYFLPHLLEDQPVHLQVRFDNRGGQTFLSVNNGQAGMPILPEGDIGLYRRDKESGLTFVGEDFVPITPAGGRVELTMGAAPDVTAKRMRVSQARPTRETSEESWRVEVVNGRSEAVTVWVEQRVFGYYTIGKAEVDGKPVEGVTEESGRLMFPVKTGAMSKAVLTVTVGHGF